MICQSRPILLSFFRRNQGAIGIMMALCLPVLTVLSVGCIELSRKNYIESQLSFAVDAAALAAARYDSDQLKENAYKIFYANFPQGTLGVQVQPKVTYDPSSGLLSVIAQATLPSDMGIIIGTPKIPISAHAFVKREMNGIEAVLVVDCYDSMAKMKKMDYLKEAATEFVTTLYEGFSTNAATAIGVVPYASLVNVGTNNVEWLTEESSPMRFPADQPWEGCVRANSYEETGDEDFTTPPEKQLWPIYLAQTTIPPVEDDCTRRDNDWDTTTRGADDRQCPPLTGRPNGDSTFKVFTPLENVNVGPNRSCVPPMLPLSKDGAAIKAAISNLRPIGGGGRMMNLGLIWGARMLSETWNGAWKVGQPNGVIIEGVEIKPYKKKAHTKALILVVDGPNHWYDNPLYPVGDPGSYGTETEDRYLPGKLGSHNLKDFGHRLDLKTLRICTALKQKGVEIFVISLNPQDADTTSLGQACATDSGHFIPVANDVAMRTAFKNIASQMRHIKLQG